MRMRIDQAGHQDLVAEIDVLIGLPRCIELGAGADGLNHTVTNRDTMMFKNDTARLDWKQPTCVKKEVSSVHGG